MAKVFVSYRKNDDPSSAVYIAHRINERFGEKTAFLDSESIPVGIDYRPKLWGTLARCAALAVIMGPRWLSSNADGIRFVDRRDDFVREEIELALKIGVPVIPVLVGDAVKPSAADLPDSLADLANRQYINIRVRSFARDVGRLLDDLAMVVVEDAGSTAAADPPAPPTATGGGIVFNRRVRVGGDVVNGSKFVTRHD